MSNIIEKIFTNVSSFMTTTPPVHPNILPDVSNITTTIFSNSANIIAFIAVVISVFSLWFTLRQNNQQKRQNTLVIYEKWDSVEFSKYRADAWDVWLDLEHGRSREVVNWLSGNHSQLSSQDLHILFPEEKKIAVRALMNYFINVYEYQDSKLLDRTLTKKLFKEPWSWWSDFFQRLRTEVEQEVMSNNSTDSKYNKRVQTTKHLDNFLGSQPEGVLVTPSGSQATSSSR